VIRTDTNGATFTLEGFTTPPRPTSATSVRTGSDPPLPVVDGGEACVEVGVPDGRGGGRRRPPKARSPLRSWPSWWRPPPRAAAVFDLSPHAAPGDAPRRRGRGASGLDRVSVTRLQHGRPRTMSSTRTSDLNAWAVRLDRRGTCCVVTGNHLLGAHELRGRHRVVGGPSCSARRCTSAPRRPGRAASRAGDRRRGPCRRGGRRSSRRGSRRARPACVTVGWPPGVVEVCQAGV